MSPVVGEIVERQAGPEDLVKLFERRALDPIRFAPDDAGRTIYDKHTVESFRALVRNVARTMRRAVYKRLQGPPIVVVSERAFGFDLRETIINKWEGGYRSRGQLASPIPELFTTRAFQRGARGPCPRTATTRRS